MKLVFPISGGFEVMLHVLGAASEDLLTPEQFRQIYSHLQLAEIAHTGSSIITPIEFKTINKDIKLESKLPTRDKLKDDQSLRLTNIFKAQETKNIRAAADAVGMLYNNAFNILVKSGLHVTRPRIRRRQELASVLQNRISRRTP